MLIPVLTWFPKFFVRCMQTGLPGAQVDINRFHASRKVPFGLHVLAMVDFYCSMHVKSGTFPKVARFFILIEKINHDKMMVFQKGSLDWR